MIKGIIYKYTSPSNKIYIGQTIHEKKRRNDFLCITTNYSGPKIDNARRKYGPENFQYEVIFRIESSNKEEVRSILNNKEKEFIELFNSISNGYNIDEGGSYTDIRYTQQCSEELRQIRSSQMKKRWKNGFRGCSDNIEAIDSMKKKLSIPILQYDLQGNFIREWQSATEAGKALKVKNSLITKTCKKQNWVCRGFIFVYKEEYPNVPETIDTSYIPEKYRLNPNGFKRGGNCKVLFQLNQDGNLVSKYGSVKEAAITLGYSDSTLRRYIRNGKLYNGFKFTYEYDE